MLIGSCTNSSFKDLMTVAMLLKGRKVNPDVSFGVVAGTRQVLRMISEAGGLTHIVDSGARILESACGFCVGYGQSPHSGAVPCAPITAILKAEAGPKMPRCYLVSPEAAVAAALTGKITDPRDLGMEYPVIPQPGKVSISTTACSCGRIMSGEVFRGPNIGSPPRNTAMPAKLRRLVTIKLGDKITTDHIIPAGSVSRYRSNVEKSADFIFKNSCTRTSPADCLD